MALRPTLALTVLPALLAACAPIAPPEQPTASANLIRTDGVVAGGVHIYPQPAALLLRINATGLPPGQHAVHIHAVGRCDIPNFDSAGPHWNPTNRKHGHLNPEGWHAGDLGNVGIGSDGKLTVGLLVPGAVLPVLRDADGSALVIHARPDDERTDPSGNSGARIACAVL